MMSDWMIESWLQVALSFPIVPSYDAVSLFTSSLSQPLASTFAVPQTEKGFGSSSITRLTSHSDKHMKWSLKY